MRAGVHGGRRWWSDRHRCWIARQAGGSGVSDSIALVEQMILRISTSYSMLCMGGRSLAGGCCAGRKASSAGCGGVVLVLVSPGLDPAYSPAVAAQEALSARCSQEFLPLPDPVCTPNRPHRWALPAWCDRASLCPVRCRPRAALGACSEAARRGQAHPGRRADVQTSCAQWVETGGKLQPVGAHEPGVGE
jgi:hypothetical protein